jgi:hypothetical protein
MTICFHSDGVVGSDVWVEIRVIGKSDRVSAEINLLRLHVWPSSCHDSRTLTGEVWDQGDGLLYAMETVNSSFRPSVLSVVLHTLTES